MTFDDFLMSVDPQYQTFALSINEYLLQNDCKIKLTQAKNGYVVSYPHGKKKRVVMNFVFRKSGLVVRIYGDHVGQYLDLLETLPENMKKSIEKAPACKRFEDPPKCSQNCVGYVFNMDEKQHQKCRYNAFMFEVNDENIPFIRTLVEKELEARNAA